MSIAHRDTAAVELRAPLSGVLVRLEDVPDPVFAQKIAGDGFSIDPTSTRLLAPLDGTIIVVHRAGHAVTLTTDEGIEVLMHIGIDTIALEGTGFRPLVAGGARVRAGDPLIAFDADYVATHAKSLLTQVIVTARTGTVEIDLAGCGAGRSSLDGTRDDREPVERPGPRSVVAGDLVARVHLRPVVSSERADERTVASAPIRIHASIHARPAAVLTSVARRFTSDVQLRVGGRHANAKSVVSIMSLEIDRGDEVTVAARGVDATLAADAVAGALAAPPGEPAQAAARPAFDTGQPAIEPGAADVLRGIPASDGLAIGVIVRFRAAEIAVAERGGSAEEERARLQAAIAAAKGELAVLRDRLRREADFGQAAIFAAHEEMLDDPDLATAAARGIASGQSAAFAWRAAFSAQADRLSALDNPLLAARAHDVRDAGGRVLNAILGRAGTAADVPPDSILVADELTPSEVAALDRARVVAVCTTGGGPTAHAAILARALAIPAVVAIDPRALDVADLTPAIVDGTRGLLLLSPPAETVATVRERLTAEAERRQRESADAHGDVVTLDGRRIEVGANAGSVADVTQAAAAGADGIGLLRTELLFMDRATPPGEDEQAEVYRAILDASGPTRPIVVRTLDVGGDKPLPWLPLPREDNPFLGVRGIRVGLDRPDLLRTQLRAIARAAAAGTLRVMFPMVATLDELLAARRMLDEACAAAGIGPIPVGVMVEVPSAALTAARLAAHADFFSIGTNDLAQYTLAMDRGHPRLARQVDALHPAVLRLIDLTVRAAHGRGKPVGVCGGAAGESRAVPLLVGLGVDELSVATPAVAAVKAQVRRLRAAACRDLAARALEAATAADVRRMVAEAFA